MVVKRVEMNIFLQMRRCEQAGTKIVFPTKFSPSLLGPPVQNERYLSPFPIFIDSFRPSRLSSDHRNLFVAENKSITIDDLAHSFHDSLRLLLPKEYGPSSVP